MINRCKLVRFNVLVEFVMYSEARNTMIRDMMIRLLGEQGQGEYGFRITQSRIKVIMCLAQISHFLYFISFIGNP